MSTSHIGAAVASVAVVSTIVHAVPADADTASPAGCAHTAVNGWAPTCWVGTNRSTSSNLVLASQALVAYFPATFPWSNSHSGFMLSTVRDGKYGGGTQGSIEIWQDDRNGYDPYCQGYGTTSCLAEDGIVGTQTWEAMQDEGLGNFSTYTANGYKYFTGQAPKAMFGFPTGGGTWMTRTPGANTWQTMTVDAGPPY